MLLLLRMTSTPDWGMELVTVTGCLFAIMTGGILLMKEPTGWHLAPLFVGALIVVLHADTTDKIPELGYSIVGFYGALIVLLAVAVINTLVGPGTVLDVLTSNDAILTGILTIVLVAFYTLSITLNFSERIRFG